jgi:cyclohexadieny/prephenate dehydrogenase
MADFLSKPLPEPLFDQLTIIGVGLIGSSLLRVSRQRNLARRLVACDASPSVADRVRELGIADEVFVDGAKAVKGSDLVILCTPVGAICQVAAQIALCVEAGAIVSDVGSVKGSVVAGCQPLFRKEVYFIPAHPVAGTEYSGPDAGFSSLFLDRWCIITPPDGADESAVERLQYFWAQAGSNVEIMTPSHHDLVLAITSHVPHLIAYNIVGTAADLEEVTQSEVIKFSAGGFRDFTRIAASDPTMWRDIFLNNKDAVLEMLGRFTEDLSALQRMIRWGDGQGLFDLFTRTRAIRRSIIAQGQETAAADFGRRVIETKPGKDQSQ